MRKASLAIALICLFITILLPHTVLAWGRTTHDYLCPEEYGIDCNMADSMEFRQNYPHSMVNHLCYDNKADCPARLLAKYYLKKYYQEGEKDKNLFGAAAHLIQDTACPDHWFPMREIFGRIFVPFAPGWIGSTEWKVDGYSSRQEKDWRLPLKWQGKILDLNQGYLDTIKEDVESFLSSEPSENLEAIDSQIRSKTRWHNLRGVKEWLWVATIVVFLGWLYDIWQWKRKKLLGKKTNLFELVFVTLVLVGLIILLGLIWTFY